MLQITEDQFTEMALDFHQKRRLRYVDELRAAFPVEIGKCSAEQIQRYVDDALADAQDFAIEDEQFARFLYLPFLFGDAFVHLWVAELLTQIFNREDCSAKTRLDFIYGYILPLVSNGV